MNQAKMRSGFTLIELLVVVGIMMLVIGFGIFRFNDFRDRQVLIRTAEKLATDIKSVQRMADSGEKTCNDTLVGFGVKLGSGTTLTVYEKCARTVNPIFSEIVVVGKTNDAVRLASGDVFFPVLSGRVDSIEEFCVELSNETMHVPLSISAAGAVEFALIDPNMPSEGRCP